MDIHTHTHSKIGTDRDRFAITSWKGEKSSKGLNFNNKWRKTQKVLIIESFEEVNEKAQYASFKHIFI